VLAHRYQHLTSHMPALFSPRRLVLNVNPSSAPLNEQPCELHDSRESTMTSISISDDRTKVIDTRLISTLQYRNRQACFSLFPIVKQLRFEEVVDFVRNGVLLHVSHMPRNLTPHIPLRIACENQTQPLQENTTYHRVVRKVRARLIRAASGRRTLPPTDIYCL